MVSQGQGGGTGGNGGNGGNGKGGDGGGARQSDADEHITDKKLQQQYVSPLTVVLNSEQSYPPDNPEQPI